MECAHAVEHVSSLRQDPWEGYDKAAQQRLTKEILTRLTRATAR